ncbi:MAG: MATE family efflux transporter [Chloroflexi bacterium]|nr:MATE family efflux transporter [Chloroflexota bacterium]MCL5275252.1 MATE family efflux transporter [Chloroflexota bacterium]
MAQTSTAVATLGDIKPESLNRTIIALAIPSVLENLLVSAVFISDTFLIGHLGDPAALAAVGISGSYLFVANGLFQALSIGSMALVARAFGEHDFAQARKMSGQSVSLAVVFSLICMVVLIPLTHTFMSLLINDPEVVRQGTIYIQLVLSTSIVAFPLQVMTGVMRATGDTRTPMYITLIMNLLNIVFAVALIFGLGPIPSLKIAGAGTATAIARAIGGLMALYVMVRGMSKLQVKVREMLVWHWHDVMRILRIAIPSIIDSLIQRVGFITFIGIVASLGTAVVAANQIANTIESLAFLPAFGLSVATTAIVGQALGARNIPIAELATSRSAILAVCVMLGTGLSAVVFGGAIAKAFGASPAILGLATMAVQLSALEQPFIALQNIFGGALRGAGDTRSPMVVSLVGVFFFRITTVYLLAVMLGLGLAGVWIGTAIDWAGRSTVMYLMYKRGRWKQLKI